MELERRWQDWVSLILGIWLFFSPFILPYASGVDQVAAWNSYLLGLAIVIVAAGALGRPGRWEEWANLALGIWLALSPWLLSFTFDRPAAWNHHVSGALVAGAAAWALMDSRHRVFAP